MQQQERSKMLGTMPMNKLVPKVAVPIMISMLVQALYNVVDGIFVARYSADAFTAVSLVFPVQMLMIAVSTGLGVGINSLISRRLGGLSAVWWSFPIAEVVSLAVCLLLYRRVDRTMLKTL